MAYEAITITVLTHPLQILLMGMIVLRGVATALSANRQARTGGGGDPVARVESGLRAAA
jgi:hypothetical protein